MSLTEITKKVETLTKSELEELKHTVQLRWAEIRRQEIAEAAELARKESAEGKTVILSSPDEIKNYFWKMIKDED